MTGAELTGRITLTLTQSQALGPDTGELLEGGRWLTASEAEKVRRCVAWYAERFQRRLPSYASGSCADALVLLGAGKATS